MEQANQALQGILIVDKPQDFTSFDVIAKLRGILKTKKIGHSGTLDPFATGVLPVFIGGCTKAISLIPAAEKRYQGQILFGIETDTLDLTGDIVKQVDRPVAEQELLAVLSTFIGVQQQIPPMYSAIKIEGKKLYQLARAGKTVVRHPREITITELALLDFCPITQIATIEVACSKGTYIRSLAADIAAKLQTVGHLVALRRLASDGFHLQESLSLSAIEQIVIEQGVTALPLSSMESALQGYERVQLSESQSKGYLVGIKTFLPERCEQEGDRLLIYDWKTRFMGIATIQKDGYLKSNCFHMRRGIYEDYT